MAKRKSAQVEVDEHDPSASRSEDLADLLFPEDTEEYSDESILDVPPEQRRLHTETYDFSITTIVQYLESSHIFIPHYQRKIVWSDRQASRLIESLIIQCPIPVIYLNQEPDERLSVIDGNQRVNAIRSYCKGEFPLRGLTTYPELDGLRFDELDPRFQRHILNRTLRCIVILKGTHPQVKFDVFERLNSGSVKLSAQELRHGIYHGPLMEFLGEAGTGKEWLKAVNVRNNARMKGEELALRFLAFRFSAQPYKKPMVAFLNQFAETNRNPGSQRIETFRSEFAACFEAAQHLFGDEAFRLPSHDGGRPTPFNAAVLDADLQAVSGVPKTALRLPEKSLQSLRQKRRRLFESNLFLASVTRATSDEQSVALRIASVRDVVRGHLRLK